MTERNFTVIEGGLSEAESERNGAETGSGWSEYRFEEAWATDTRLMGVLVLFVRWSVKGTGADLRQFFYFDVSEYGLDRFEWVENGDAREIEMMENSFIGGLGAEKIPVTESEAIHLVNKFIDHNAVSGIPLPPGAEAFFFITGLDAGLTEQEETALFDKLCADTEQPEAATNYFLMRCCDKDEEALRFLKADGSDADGMRLFSKYPALTFYRNDVERTDVGSVSRSIVGDDRGHYHEIHTRLVFRHGNKGAKDRLFIESCEITHTMKISDQEAYMHLRHNEYVTVFDYSGSLSSFERGATELMKKAMPVEEAGGLVFMIYRPDNAHAAKPCYHIYDDLLATYYLTYGGELICATNSVRDSLRVEFDIATSGLKAFLTQKGNFQFESPVMNYMIQGDFYSFEEFLNAIRDDE